MFRANAVKMMSEMTILPPAGPTNLLPPLLLPPDHSLYSSLPHGGDQLPANLRRRPLPPV
jgi:hypothetical protein